MLLKENLSHKINLHTKLQSNFTPKPPFFLSWYTCELEYKDKIHKNKILPASRYLPPWHIRNILYSNSTLL